MERFMGVTSIVTRVQTDKFMLSAAKQQLIEREVAFYLGALKQEFSDGLLNECNVLKADETQFIADLNDSHILATKGNQHVK